MSHQFIDPVTGEYETEVVRTIADVESSVVTYYGQTLIQGAAYSDPVWQIRKTTRIGSLTETVFAGLGQYTYAWSDRTSLFPTPAFFNTYSTLFDGINDHITFGDAFNYDSSNQWSLSIWLKPDNLSTRHTIYSKTTADANVFGWGFYQETGGPLFIQMRASGQTRQHTGSLLLTAQVWNHLVITYDGSNNINGLRVYINGVQDVVPASGVVTNTLLYNQTAMIGTRNNFLFFPGNMDEMAIYDKALSQAEVTEIYNSGSPLDLTAIASSGNLQHYYRLGDSDTAPLVFDNVGAVDGTMTNMGTVFSGDVP